MMHFKKTDRVVLPQWSFDQGKHRPVWGGPEGYHIGVVEKIQTHDHDQSKHMVLVNWDNGEFAAFPESALRKATNDEVDVSLDARHLASGIDRDVWVLIRTTAGNFSLNVIEVDPFSSRPAEDRKKAPFVLGSTRCILRTVENSDYNLVGDLIMAADFIDSVWQTLFEAAQKLFEVWELPALESVPLPLPEFTSVREAAASAPPGAAVLFFHLPQALKDYADTPGREEPS